VELFKKDKDSKYVSENNSDFLEESGLINYYKNNDMFLRPSMVSSCSYDIMFASLNAETPLRYDMNYRNYILTTHGKVTIRLFAPKATKYLYPVNDYENFEFISPVNPWSVQEKYRSDFDKLRSIDVSLMPGQMINVPAYWWYSIKFVKSNTSLCVFKYKTYMSVLSISNHFIMRMLQRQNTKRVIAKQMRVIAQSALSESNDTEGSSKDIKIDMPIPIPIPIDTFISNEGGNSVDSAKKYMDIISNDRAIDHPMDGVSTATFPV
jgi:hypothetical protein